MARHALGFGLAFGFGLALLACAPRGPAAADPTLEAADPAPAAVGPGAEAAGRKIDAAAAAQAADGPLALAAAAAPAADGPQAETAYPLDTIERTVPPRGRLQCPKVELVDYSGEIIRFSAPAKVFIGFRDRLKELEKVARDVGVEVYGRAPSRVAHLGTYSCRRIAAYPGWLSEHALGNSIDIAGFDFGPLPGGATLPVGLPGAFKHGLQVRVLSHWKASSGHAAVHARFLKTLAQRLIARNDIFRVLLGPGYPGHSDHFHFDVAPFRMVEIYDNGQRIVAPAAESAGGAGPG